MFKYLLCIYKKNILSLFKIDTLNLTMYILTILTCNLIIYIIRLYNLISMKMFFTIKDHSFLNSKTNKLKKPLKTQTSLNPFSMNIFTTKDDSFPL